MRCLPVLAVVVLLCAGVAPVSTTIFAPMDLPELVSDARTIVYGRVVETRASIVNGRTETHVTLGVPAYLKGDGEREVVFSVPGGQIGRYRTVVVGAPVLQPGDEIVVFLYGDGARAMNVVGFSQGVLRVVRESPGATPMVLSPPFARDGRPQRVLRGGATRRFVDLATLVEDVRTLAAGSAGTTTGPRRQAPGSARREARSVRRASLVRALVLGVLAAAGSWATAEAYLKYGVRVNNQQISLRWQHSPVEFFLNDDVPAGVTPSEFQGAVTRAFGSWSAVKTAGVTFKHVGNIGSRPFEQDGVSVLGFLARPEMDRVLGATTYVVDVVTGEIVECDIFFNTTFPWSTATGGEAGRYDVESIALHEIGHFLGLGHSALGETELRSGGGRRVIAAESAMFPIAFSAGSIEGRRLRADDVAGVSDIYGGASFLEETGSVSGRVTKNGQPLFGAHVVAFNPATGKLVGNFTLGTNGDFAIAGLDPGPHILRVEPLDDADLTSFFSEDRVVDLDFKVTYLDRLAVVPKGGNAGPYTIKVTPR